MYSQAKTIGQYKLFNHENWAKDAQWDLQHQALKICCLYYNSVGKHYSNAYTKAALATS